MKSSIAYTTRAALKRSTDHTQPPRAVRKSLKYRETDEHILRRLASALILHWDAVSDDLQDLLLEQATLVGDHQRLEITQGQIEDFVRTVKAVAVREPLLPEPASPTDPSGSDA